MTTSDISNLILSTAANYGVDPRLALEVAMQESGLNEAAVSPAGAIGIFQLMPATAADLGVDPTDPAQNIDGGVRYLAQMLSRYAGNVAEALAAYNWGPSHVDAAIAANGGAWLSQAPAETQNYVQTIVGNVSSQYSVSVGSPAPASLFSADTQVASVVPTGWTIGTALWVAAALLAGWFVFSLLE